MDTRNIVDAMKGMDEERIRMIYKENSLPFAVCVVNLTGGLNTGIIFRTANAMGAERIFYFGKKHFDKRSAVGIFNYSTVEYISDFEELKNFKQKYVFVGIENNIPDAISEREYTYKRNSLFFMGEEGYGLDKEILDLCDDKIFIPQIGTVRSLNVSTAAGIIMYGYSRVHGSR